MKRLHQMMGIFLASSYFYLKSALGEHQKYQVWGGHTLILQASMAVNTKTHRTAGQDRHFSTMSDMGSLYAGHSDLQEKS